MLKLFWIYFLCINVYSFFIFGFDKFQAKREKRRISEKQLLSLTWYG
ncbi:MAG: DUF1294 domain-containing protein [Candidatus Peribacteria bacterium]|nr:MAG: DUF1294 domain-containing protein [Candidatus Peribacteria bacterium]